MTAFLGTVFRLAAGNLLRGILTATARFRRGDGKKRILLFRNDMLGDFIVSLPFLQKCSRFFRMRGYVIAVVVSSSQETLARRSGYFDEIIPMDRRAFAAGLRNRIRLLGRIAALKAELCVNPVHHINAAPLLFVAGGRKYGFDWSRWPLRNRMHRAIRTQMLRCYTKTVPDDRRPIFDLEEELFFVISGEHYTPCVAGALNFALPPYSALPTAGKQYYVLAPGASSLRRAWPPERCAMLIGRLKILFPHLQAVLTGTADEIPLGRRLQNESGALNLCGALSLSEFFGVIGGAAFLIGNDSGAVHAAAALEKLSFAVAGGGYFGIYFPSPYYPRCHTVSHRFRCRNCRWQCSRKEEGCFPCIEAVSVEDVVRAIREHVK